MTKIKKFYKDFRTSDIDVELFDLEKKIRETAKKSPSELQELINIFENESEMFYKMDLADILADISNKEIIPFLIKVALDENEDKENRFAAMMNLVKLQHPSGYKVAIELAQYEKECPGEWFVGELHEIGNPMAKELIEDLIKKYKHIAAIMAPFREKNN